MALDALLNGLGPLTVKRFPSKAFNKMALPKKI
jgi:hypothetical protein